MKKKKSKQNGKPVNNSERGKGQKKIGKVVNQKMFKSIPDAEANVISNAKKFINRKGLTLKERMEYRIKGAKFRIMNERLYTSNKDEVKTTFDDKTEFQDYHEGYRQQVKQWPVNPLKIIIDSIRKRANSKPVIADFGCGEAEIAKTFPSCKVHSFDFYALNEHVTPGDMGKTRLEPGSVDVAVFCLSLMGSSNSRYIQEANRVLKEEGSLKIAEIESRFDDPKKFVDEVCKHGFSLVSQNLSHDVFLFFDFKKSSNISKKRKNKLPEVSLNPCMYKKR